MRAPAAASGRIALLAGGWRFQSFGDGSGGGGGRTTPRDEADAVPLRLTLDAAALGMPVTAHGIVRSRSDAYDHPMPNRIA